MEKDRRLEVAKSVVLLDQTLQALARVPQGNYHPNAIPTLKRSLGSMLWKALPIYVTSLDLGDDVMVERQPEQTQPIPEEQAQMWSLQEVDQFAARQAKAIGMEWEPKFS